MVQSEIRGQKQYDVPKVVAEVQQAFKMLAGAFHVSINDKDVPNVRIDEKHGTSYYNSEKNEISISPDQIDDGNSYFEEASHALRHLAVNRRNILTKLFSSGEQDSNVDEFYGMAGEIVGRKLVRGTRLEHLFGVEPRSFKNPKEREAWLEGMKILRRERAKLKEMRQKGLPKKQGPKEDYFAFVNAAERSYEELIRLSSDLGRGKVSFQEFRNRTEQIGKSYGESVKGRDALGLSSNYVNSFDTLKEALDYAEAHPHEKMEHVKGGLEIVREAKEDLIKSSGDLKKTFGAISGAVGEGGGSAELTQGLKVLRYEKMYRGHHLGYKRAQQYSAEEFLEENNFYSLSDKRVRDKFFVQRERRSSLEKKVEYGRAIAGILAVGSFILAALVSLRFTGFVISSNVQANNIVGVVLLALAILFGWGYFRKLN